MCDSCGCGEKEKTFKDQVSELIQAMRPSLQSHGGDIELVDIEEDNTVKVRLQGACSGCPGAQMTLKNGVEHILKQRLPQVKEVVAVK